MTFRFVPANVEFADGYIFSFPASWSIAGAYEVAVNAYVMHYMPCDYADGASRRAFAEASSYKVYLTLDGREHVLYKVHYGVS